MMVMMMVMMIMMVMMKSENKRRMIIIMMIIIQVRLRRMRMIQLKNKVPAVINSIPVFVHHDYEDRQ